MEPTPADDAAGPASSPKAAARREAARRIATLGATVREQHASRICKHLFDEPSVTAARCVMAFAPLADEPDITPLLTVLIGMGITVTVPEVNWAAGTMRAVAVSSITEDLITELTHARLALRSPRPGLRAVPVELIDLVLVPGRAFDASGRRLGRGKGFYDRFLPALGPHVATIGVCFSVQLLERVPTDEHDRTVGAVVTELGHTAAHSV